ncbi:probable gluconokinase isoform X1 [Octodon degus]|uniref:Gluconokinase n=1 Tax=Octodon degus TaxID=10160 RepID=A0A6P3FK99_OCTDE|nr:probable gluconokinase isoform X1 [Octodon degus]
MAAPSALLVMGVSGAGKSTVGSMLASELGWKFYDADDFHPEENRVKMGKGIPLSDQDRIPWLCSLHDILLRDAALGQRVVLACSALKKMYRDILRKGKDNAPPECGESKKEKCAKVQLFVVHLSGSFKIISGRLRQRKGHFMPPELLQSQFDTLEPPTAPENFIQISVDKKLSEIITTVTESLKMECDLFPVIGLEQKQA